jgi:hypothetical protein
MAKMKNLNKMLGIITIGVVIAMTVVGCGGGNPKALAKQTYDLGMQALGAMLDPSKAAELEKKATDIEKKVAKLSEADQAVYYAELTQLSGAGLGSLFEAAGSALDSVNTETVQDALDAGQKAVDAAQKTNDALKALGF